MASALPESFSTHQNLISGTWGIGRLRGTLPITDTSVLPSRPGLDQPNQAATSEATIRATSMSICGRWYFRTSFLRIQPKQSFPNRCRVHEDSRGRR
jgi:hypothetical protein